MSLTLATYTTTMQNMLEVNDTNGMVLFAGIVNNMIDYAELRILRDLDLLSTVVTQTYTATVGDRRVPTVPGALVTVTGMNLITPANIAPELGTRHPLWPVSKFFLDNVCPSAAIVSTPQLAKYFAVLTEDKTQLTTILIGPTCDATYILEVTGTARPLPLYSDPSGATFISTFLPDLFIAASMVFGTGWQRDFGQQADNTGQAMSWEQQYKTLLAGALSEEQRKKGWGQAWSAHSATPAQPPRQ